MSTFTYKSQFGEYPDCQFQTGRYNNGNLAVEIWSTEEGPITRVTVNPGIKISDAAIAIKNYSENEGMVDWLLSENIIEGDPISEIPSGWVKIPVYQLSAHGKELLDI